MRGYLADCRKRMPAIVSVATWVVFGVASFRVAGAEEPVAPPMQELKTPSGARFALYGEKQSQPAPTLLVFATSLEGMQKTPIFTSAARRLAQHGFLYVAIDPPCHGADSKPDEPPELRGWRYRVEQGQPLIADFTARAASVLDYLIAEGYTDADRVLASGTSRGGFLACHFAAADKRIKAVAAISPVADLADLSEFRGVQEHEGVRALALANLAPTLAGRPVWLSIGNNDARVNTDAAISFTRKLVTAGLEVSKTPNPVVAVELIVGPSAGHSAIQNAYELAATWLLKQLPPLSPATK